MLKSQEVTGLYQTRTWSNLNELWTTNRTVFVKEIFTYPNIFVKNFNDNSGRVHSDLIHITPQHQVFKHQHLIPRRTSCFPDHTSISDQVGEDHTGEGICQQNIGIRRELWTTNSYSTQSCCNERRLWPTLRRKISDKRVTWRVDDSTRSQSPENSIFLDIKSRELHQKISHLTALRHHCQSSFLPGKVAPAKWTFAFLKLKQKSNNPFSDAECGPQENREVNNNFEREKTIAISTQAVQLNLTCVDKMVWWRGHQLVSILWLKGANDKLKSIKMCEY